MSELTVRDGEDARSQARRSLVELRPLLRAAGRARNVDADTKAHLDDSLARIEEILAAQVQRMGF